MTARSRDGRRSGSTTVVANEPRLYDGLRIVLSGLGNAAFRVLDENGQPVKGQPVALLGQLRQPLRLRARRTPTPTASPCSRTSPTAPVTPRPSAPTATFTDVARLARRRSADGHDGPHDDELRGGGRGGGHRPRRPRRPRARGRRRPCGRTGSKTTGSSVCDLEPGFTAGTRTGLDGALRLHRDQPRPGRASPRQQDFFGERDHRQQRGAERARPDARSST